MLLLLYCWYCSCCIGVAFRHCLLHLQSFSMCSFAFEWTQTWTYVNEHEHRVERYIYTYKIRLCHFCCWRHFTVVFGKRLLRHCHHHRWTDTVDIIMLMGYQIDLCVVLCEKAIHLITIYKYLFRVRVRRIMHTHNLMETSNWIMHVWLYLI